MKSLAYYTFRFRRAILALTGVAAIAAGFYGSTVFDTVKPFGFDDPGSESVQANHLIANVTGEEAVPSVVVVVQPDAEADSSSGRRLIAGVTRRLAAIDGVLRVTKPEAGGPLVSRDGRTVLVAGSLAGAGPDLADVGEDVIAEFAGDPELTPGGAAVAAHELNETTARELRVIELYAAPLLLLISFLVFRGLVAALLPLVVGGLSIIFTLAGLRALSEITTIDIFALNVVTVLGLGLAIDYSLFMVSRYREEINRFAPGEAALLRTLQPVGRMVCFSALIVAVATSSLVVFPQAFLRSAGIGCALVALVSAGVVMIVLPALLSCLGNGVNALSPAGIQRDPERRRTWPKPKPLITALGVAALMIVIGLPFQRVTLAPADARVLPADQMARQADELIRAHFKADPAAGVLVVLPGAIAFQSEIERARQTLSRLPGITGTSKLRLDNGVGRVRAIVTAPQGTASAADLVDSVGRLDWGGPSLLTGPQAEAVDQNKSLRSHLPWALLVILAATVIVLTLMTGSLVIAGLGVIVNGLTVSVAFGLLVTIFQDGRLESLLGFSSVGSIDSSVPILLFAAVFALSTDYGVFLFSRIDEARSRGIGDEAAIAIGVEETGSIIFAAALLFSVAMGSFVFSDMIFIKEIAVGTAAAVLIDATLVRALLFPALLRLLGPTAWWGPSWLKVWRLRL